VKKNYARGKVTNKVLQRERRGSGRVVGEANTGRGELDPLSSRGSCALKEVVHGRGVKKKTGP